MANATPSEMVHAILPEASVESVAPVDGGTHDLWFVTAETATGRRDCVLKAQGETPEATARTRRIEVESRLLELLGAVTDLPVPEILGSVDSHDELPAPFFLMSRIEGSPIRTDPWDLSTSRLERLARTIGGHLAHLHAVGAFDAFGAIRTRGDAEEPGGTRALGQEYGLTIARPFTSWRERVDTIADEELGRLSESRFADLEHRVRSVVVDRVADVREPDAPVIAQFDYNLENVLVDVESGSVSGVVDWELGTTATHPEWHLVWTEANYCQAIPLSSARRERVRSALYEGYTGSRSIDIDDGFERRRRFYHLLRAVIAMNQIELFPGDGSDYRRFVRELL